MKLNNINNKEPWLDKLKERVNNYSEPVPASGWEQLEKELGPSQVAPVFFLKRHKWGIAAAAALLAAVSTIGLYFAHTPHLHEINQVAEEIIEQRPDVLLPIAAPEKSIQIAQAAPIRTESISKTANKQRGVNQTITQHSSAIETIHQEEVHSATNDTFTTNAESSITASSDKLENNATNVETNTVTEKKTSTRVMTVRKPSSRDKLHIPNETTNSSKKGNWSMGANIGNAGSISSNSETSFSGTPYRINMAISDNGIYTVPDNYTIIFNEGLPYMLSADEVIHAKHHQPIAVGLTARKNFKYGFSIETGLTFTLLSSDISMAGDINKTLKQKLYYLGIPVKANWNFLDKKFVTLYLSAGGQIEKSVHGKLGDEKLNVKPVQFSVMGGVGAQFNVTQRFGIYVEPGVAYFFNDGSDIQTIRKEHPFNFNMQAGVRFSY